MAGFNPLQPRDREGQWADRGGILRKVGDRPITRLAPTVVTPDESLDDVGPDDVEAEGQEQVELPVTRLPPVIVTPAERFDDAAPDAPEIEEQDWVELPGRGRIPELGDLLEAIANARPEDEPALRSDIARYYYDVGDVRGGDALNRALSEALEEGITREDRARILRDFERYTQGDPADAAALSGIAAGLAGLRGPAPRPQARPNRSAIWSQAWATRGFNGNRVLNDRLIEWLKSEGHSHIFKQVLSDNFPVIDLFVNRIAVSNKMLDLDAAYYRNPERVRQLLTRHARKLSRFDFQVWAGQEVRLGATQRRVLHVGVPLGSVTPAHRAAIRRAMRESKQLGVEIRISEI